jgi:2-C-methyl-D-erythritol 4-phosphate cytidylyltransferase
VKRATDSFVMATIDRSDLFLAQTPQVFGYDLILKAHREAAENGLVVTDDAGLIEKGGFKVRIVEPKELNIKVTSREDMLIVETILLRGDNE